MPSRCRSFSQRSQLNMTYAPLPGSIIRPKRFSVSTISGEGLVSVERDADRVAGMTGFDWIISAIKVAT
jgi:hypothetical protein